MKRREFLSAVLVFSLVAVPSAYAAQQEITVYESPT